MRVNKISMEIKTILTILLAITNFHSADSAACILRNGERGECVLLKDCRSAILLLRQRINPTYCNFQRGSVCCVNYKQETEIQSGRGQNSQGNQNNFSVQQNQHTGSGDSHRSEQNFNDYEKKSQRNERNENGLNRGSRSDEVENLEKTPNNVYSESGDQSERRVHTFNRRHSNGFQDERRFVPPGLGKKKQWNNEKTTDNDYSYESVTKKPNRGQGHKGQNKFNNGNGHGHGNRPVWGEGDSERPVWSSQEEKPTRRPVWSSQEQTTVQRPVWSSNEGQKEPDNYDNENSNNYERPTTKRNKWGQETTTVRNFGNEQGGNNNGGNSGGFNWPQRTTTQSAIPFPQPDSWPQGNRPTSRPGSQVKKSISELKCEEYSEEVTETISGLPLTANPDPVYISVRKCLQAQQLIVGGANTTIGEFPHMAAVGFQDRNKQGIGWKCGGTLISSHFVLTAAHCTSTSLGPPVRVRLGEYNLRKTDDGAHPVDYSISEIINHPDYKPPSKYHDIALLRLSEKVRFNKLIRPACLHLDDDIAQSKAIATGWGRTFYDGSVSEILQKVVLSIVDKDTCNSLYKQNIRTEVLSRGIIDSQLCAGELSGGKDTCQGDSGGPLSITNTKCIHHIIGITSFGKSCALPNSTGVYTRISAYVPWIESIVWPEE